MNAYQKIYKFFNQFVDSYKYKLTETSYDEICNYCSLLFDKHITQNQLAVPNLIIWNYKIFQSEFKLKTTISNFSNVSTLNFKKFVHSIKPCFIDYFAESLTSFISYLDSNKDKDINGYCLQMSLPIRLENNLWKSLIYIKPCVYEGVVVELDFVLIPIKKYDNEPISSYVLVNSKINKMATSNVKGKIKLKNLLTKEQKMIFKLLLRGYNSGKIARELGKTQNNVLKFNIRITSTLSDFFDYEFESVQDAVTHYEKCFLKI